MPRLLTHPLTLALLLTLSNAVKPVVIDDTAYLLFARHLAQHPINPYGFDLFWYMEPEPAMEIILPPVLPYWLAGGIAIFGEDLLLLKFWLFPVAAMLAYSSRSLVRRFVSHESPIALALLVVGPGVLPFFNFMLDIPALALQAAAVALCAYGMDRPRRWSALALAGVCMGLALQTKYAVLGLPAVVFAMTALRRRWAAGAVVLAVGLALFAAWELFLVAKYGQSHFVYHLTRKGGEAGGLVGLVASKFPLILPLFALLGLTAGWVGLVGLARVVAPRTLRVVGGGIALLALVIVWAPARWTILIPAKDAMHDPTAAADVLFRVVGGLAFIVGVRFAFVTAFRSYGLRPRRAWEARFLFAWFVLEVGTYFAVTPFPAARRVLGITVVLTLLALRAWVRLKRIEPRLKAAGWVLTAGLLTGLGVAAIDVWDALPERELPRRAAELARDRGYPGRGYFIGHWGMQYYAEQSGLRIVVPGRTRFEPGDWLLVPVNPDGRDFFRPNGAWIVIDPTVLEVESVLTWDDHLSAQTIPQLYAGRTPLVGLTHSRLKLLVCRVKVPWTPPAMP